MTPKEVEDVFRSSGAFLEGHFVLASGRHSPKYLEKFQVLQWPAKTEALCATIVERVRAFEAETVAGPTTGGVVLAHEVGRQLGTRAVYAERKEGGPGREFRRGFPLRPGERVLVVDDIMSTGGSVEETIAAVRDAGASVVGAAVLVDRSGGAAAKRLGAIPLVALWEVEIETYDPASCPQCAAGQPIRKPGTTPAGKERAR
ncbi:MAG: orotate phosphoribosyltransferase [Chloroflexota bacterium]|nr:orotate phosphoribosyltransferase [Chloroflexota bacterium]MDE3194601.1 orotate phosphoribosyltransferase [Chloroflexota bacterium]